MPVKVKVWPSSFPFAPTDGLFLSNRKRSVLAKLQNIDVIRGIYYAKYYGRVGVVGWPLGKRIKNKDLWGKN